MLRRALALWSAGPVRQPVPVLHAVLSPGPGRRCFQGRRVAGERVTASPGPRTPPSTAAAPRRHALRSRWPLLCGTTRIPMTSSPWQASRPDPPRVVPSGQSEGPPPSSSSLYKIPPLFPPARACHGCVVVAMVTSTVSSRSRATTGRLSTPPPPWTSTATSRAICCPSRALLHRSMHRPQLPPHGATELTHRRHRNPNSSPQARLGELAALPHRFPGRPHRRSHQNSDHHAAGLAKGHIEAISKCLGSFLWTRVLSVRNQKLLGACMQNWILNSIGFWMNLRKFVENCRKNRKMQT
jgi:hypothetical protein